MLVRRKQSLLNLQFALVLWQPTLDPDERSTEPIALKVPTSATDQFRLISGH